MPLWFVISFYARYVIFASDLLYHKSRWYLERRPPFLILPFNHQWDSVALNEDQFLQEGLKMSNSKMILKIYFPNNFCNFASEQKKHKKQQLYISMGINKTVAVISIWMAPYESWLPAHQQDHQCLWFLSCYNVTHVFCPHCLYSVGNEITTTTTTTSPFSALMDTSKNGTTSGMSGPLPINQKLGSRSAWSSKITSPDLPETRFGWKVVWVISYGSFLKKGEFLSSLEIVPWTWNGFKILFVCVPIHSS